MLYLRFKYFYIFDSFLWRNYDKSLKKRKENYRSFHEIIRIIRRNFRRNLGTSENTSRRVEGKKGRTRVGTAAVAATAATALSIFCFAML